MIKRVDTCETAALALVRLVPGNSHQCRAPAACLSRVRTDKVSKAGEEDGSAVRAHRSSDLSSAEPMHSPSACAVHNSNLSL